MDSAFCYAACNGNKPENRQGKMHLQWLYPLYGRVKVVDSFADLDVKIVSAFADVEVKVVEGIPSRCGEWKFVEDFPDVKIRFVDAFPNVTIKYVDAFPGIR